MSGLLPPTETTWQRPQWLAALEGFEPVCVDFEARPRAKGQSSPAPRRATAPRKRTGEAPRRPAKAGPAESKQAVVIAMLQGRQGARPTLDHGDAPARHHVRSAEYRARRASGNLETSRRGHRSPVIYLC